MKINIFFKNLFFLISILIVYNNFSFGLSLEKKNKRILIKNLDFLKKNECFSFVKVNRFFEKKEKFFIKNNKFIGFLRNNKFKMFYVVKKKDTLYSIAKISGHNYFNLAQANFIDKPYKIIVGEKIWIGDFLIDSDKNHCSIINIDYKKNKQYNTCQSMMNIPLNFSMFIKKKFLSNKICFSSNKECQNDNFLKKKSFIFSNDWNWPVKDKNIQYFYNSQYNNKNIEIFGFKGQPIFAAASGKIVYISDAFEKYGKLIIIKHNENYMSIYACNDSILVKLNEVVYKNQKIATMGLSENHSVRLYFEIRYKGESINPLNLLIKVNKKK